ncbi:MAG: peptidoglycan editing factor PgeF [Aminipila sp.]
MFNENKIKRKNSTVPLNFHNGDVPYLTVPAFEAQDSVIHGFSTRLGGVSTGDFSSMNVSFTRGDSPAMVTENYKRLGNAIGFDPQYIVASSQTHTTNIKVVDLEDCGKGFDKIKDYSDIDGLITNIPGIVLTTFYADCVPLLLLDPVNKVIGAAHSGWRGTVSKIGTKVVNKMVEVYGCNTKDIIVAIGPSICQDCYEVSQEVIDRFKDSYASQLWPSLFYPTIPGKYQLNLWEACRQNFLEAGISSEHISIPDICTCCNPELLYSHRIMGEKRGNFAAFITLKS